MNYDQIPPCQRLSQYVKYFWVGEAEASKERHFTHHFVATSCAKMIFHYKGQFEKNADGIWIQSLSSGIQGQSKIHAQYRANEDTGIFGIEFFPYAIPLLFSIPATELTNQLVDVKTFLGKKGQELEDRIVTARTDQERVLVATRFLESSIKMPANGYVIEAISRINSAKGLINMTALVKDLPVSQRQFERTFKEMVGFAPKSYARIRRFESALSRFNDAHSFTEIALDSGYFDQAHFIHDFTEFTGLQPTQYFNAIADLPLPTG